MRIVHNLQFETYHHLSSWTAAGPGLLLGQLRESVYQIDVFKNLKFGSGFAFLRLLGHNSRSTNLSILNNHGNADQFFCSYHDPNPTCGTDRAERYLDSLTELIARFTFHS